MSLWSRMTNLFRGDALAREIDEEIQSHIEEAIEHGRDPAEARRAFGSALAAAKRAAISAFSHGSILFVPTPSSAGGSSRKGR